MTDIGNPAGFDVATVLTGSGLTLLISAGILRYGDRFEFTEPELYGLSGLALVVIGLLFGVALVIRGYR